MVKAETFFKDLMKSYKLFKWKKIIDNEFQSVYLATVQDRDNFIIDIQISKDELRVFINNWLKVCICATDEPQVSELFESVAGEVAYADDYDLDQFLKDYINDATKNIGAELEEENNIKDETMDLPSFNLLTLKEFEDWFIKNYSNFYWAEDKQGELLLYAYDDRIINDNMDAIKTIFAFYPHGFISIYQHTRNKQNRLICSHRSQFGSAKLEELHTKILNNLYKKGGKRKW